MTANGAATDGRDRSLLRRLLRFSDLLLALAVASVPALLAFAEALPGPAAGAPPVQHPENVPAAVRTLGHVLAFAVVPSIVSGTLYGLAWNARSAALAVLGRIAASGLIVALGLFAFLVGAVSADTYYPPDPKFVPPPPFGAHVGALVGTKFVLALSGFMALLLVRSRTTEPTESEEERHEAGR